MFENFILVLEIIGTIAFAISGAMIAIENKLDIFGVVILGATTAVGGGVIRDIMLQRPIAMFEDPKFAYIALTTSLIVFLLFYFLKDISITQKKYYQTLITIFDALGLGIFVILGAKIAMNLNKNLFSIIFMSTITAVGGGIVRDLMARKIPAVFRKHIYAVAAITQAFIFYGFYCLNVNYYFNVIFSIIFIVCIRYLSYRFEWSLPKVRYKN